MLTEVDLQDIVTKLGKNCYIKLDVKFCKKLFKDVSNDIFPPYNNKLANFLGVKFYGKWNVSSRISRWYYLGILPLWSVNKILRLSKYTWKDVENNLIGLRLHGGIKKIYVRPKFPIKLDKSMGIIIGHILGDGSIGKKLFQPFYSNKDKQLLNNFKVAMENIFGVNTRIWSQKSGNFKEKTKWIARLNSLEEIQEYKQCGLFYPKICGIILHAIFGKFASGNHKEITKVIFETSEEFKAGLISAFYDDECTIYVDSSEIRLFQENKRILEVIRDLLKQFKINSSKLHCYIRNGKRHYYFGIFGIENFKRFKEFIGLTSLRKSMLLNKLIDFTEIGLKYKIQKGLIKSKLINLLKEKSMTITELLHELSVLDSHILWRRRSLCRCLGELRKNGLVNKNQLDNKIIWSLNENSDNIS